MNIKELLENACGTLTILTGEEIGADLTHDELPGGADPEGQLVSSLKKALIQKPSAMPGKTFSIRKKWMNTQMLSLLPRKN